MSSASEIYQNVILTAFAGIEDVGIISDDIVVHGPNQSTHYQRLHETLLHLCECGFPLNAEKCRFNMDTLASVYGHAVI